MRTEKMNQDLLKVMSLQENLRETDLSPAEFNKRKKAYQEAVDVFVNEHGFMLEGVLMDIYDEYSPDTAYESIVSYLPHSAKVKDLGQDYEASPNDGAAIEVDDYPGQKTRLVLLPNPLRFVMTFGNKPSEEVWNVEKVVNPFI